MRHFSPTDPNRNRLLLFLALFFLALAVPTGILIHQSYRQLKWETLHQHQVMAEELAARIDARLIGLFRGEEARAYTDYAFLMVAGDPAASFLQRSPLSGYPVASPIPGLIGYFQVDAQGRLSTPLLPPTGTEPAAYGIAAGELKLRLALAERIRQILSENRLVRYGTTGTAGGKTATAEIPERRDRQTEPVPAGTTTGRGAAGLMPRDEAGAAATAASGDHASGQAAFDRLNETPGRPEQESPPQAPGTLGRVEDLKLDARYQAELADAPPREQKKQKTTPSGTRAMRKEYSALPEPAAAPSLTSSEADAARTALQSPVRILTFESEIDPFEVSRLDSGQFVLFRKVWRDGQRYIQGALIEQLPFLQGVIQSSFNETALSGMSDLVVAYRGDVLSAFTGATAGGYLSSTGELSGALLYQTRLSAPLNDVELIFSVRHLPAGPGGELISWLAAILSVMLCGGFYLMYRLGVGQINLARQQQDFVSAVSHELKTPLTSIRMYGEILREGWTPEEKKRTYYDYIFDESERLSRLIGNVLQLSRMTRNDLQVDIKPVSVAELMDGIRSRVAAQIERAGFEYRQRCEDAAARSVIRVDADGFTQIIINLVDNALKFSARAARQAIDLTCRLEPGGHVLFTVRDYGPGVTGDQMKKIFRLFYRSENELTRKTVGTGIGLALVHQLATAMHGTVNVVDATPGAEFRVSFPVTETRYQSPV
jgi:signal transduction histidine kinase